jgi:hypothetical protein
MEYDVIIFANSVKHGEHCVAGKFAYDRKWIRLVADDAGRELTRDQVIVETKRGSFKVMPLEIVKVDILRIAPLRHQPENHIINDVRWRKGHFFSHHEISNFLDSPATLWGVGNCIAAQDVLTGNVQIAQSLYLIRADEITLHMHNDRRRVAFTFNNQRYDLPSTDPNFDKIKCGARAMHGFICVSLGEEHNGYHYKIVAAVI